MKLLNWYKEKKRDAQIKRADPISIYPEISQWKKGDILQWKWLKGKYYDKDVAIFIGFNGEYIYYKDKKYKAILKAKIYERHSKFRVAALEIFENHSDHLHVLFNQSMHNRFLEQELSLNLTEVYEEL